MVKVFSNFDLLGLEAELVNRLDSLNQDTVRVMATPENEAELKAPRGDRILVAFRGISLQSPGNRINPQAQIVQEGDIRFAVILQVKDLRSHEGALPLIQKTIELLTGFCPEITGGAIYCTGADFTGLENNIWTWSLSFSAPVVYVKKPR